jgi:cytochrome c peroxidase
MFGVFGVFGLLAGCGDTANPGDGFTDAEWIEIRKLSPLPDPPPDPTNRYADNADAAKLGQALFYDKRLSGPITFTATGAEGMPGNVGDEGRFNCVSCHDQNHYFVDDRSNPDATSLGPAGWLPRNALTLTNAVYYDWSGWQGFIDTFWGHSVIGVEAPVGENGDRLRTAHLLYSKYRDQYNALFDPDLDPALDPAAPDAARFPAVGKPKGAPMLPDGPWEGMTPEDQDATTLVMINASKALAAYVRHLVKRDAAFDQYVAGSATEDYSAIPAAAKRGLKLFIGKAACVKCHEGPFFSDQKFHNTGVPQEGLHVPMDDPGRTQGIQIIQNFLTVYSSAGPYTDAPPNPNIATLATAPTDLGAFRTQGLRNSATTGPYMHTGAFPDLRSVVELYNVGGKTDGFMGSKDQLILPLSLTDQEMNDLVAFVQTLTGQPLPDALLQDTSAP